MEPPDVRPHLKALKASISSLESALQPLLKPTSGSSLSEIASKLPLLDKAKLNVTLAYSIHSILFSALRLNGVEAKEHPVFTTELARCRQYFEKIEKAERRGAAGSGAAPRPRIDKAAAARFVKHGITSGAWRDSGKKPSPPNSNQDQVTSDETSPGRKRKAPHEKNLKEDEGGKHHKKRKHQVEDPVEEDGAAGAAEAGQADSREAPTDDVRSRQKRKKERKAAAKSKSSKPPRGSKEVFQDLLGRGDKASGEKSKQ